MKKSLFTLSLVILGATAFGQQFFMEVFSGFNNTAYDQAIFPDRQNFISGGARIAAGADHVQIGGEFHTNLTNPEFDFQVSTQEHSETYYGAFIRSKIARYPAARFGLVLRAGAGVHNFETTFTNLPVEKVTYDPILGFNAGAGFSIPVLRAVMLELSYNYYYADRPEISEPGLVVQKFNSSYHSIQAGLSLNLVFGERAEAYRQLRSSRRPGNG